MLPRKAFVGIEMCVELLKCIWVADNSDSDNDCLVFVKQVRTYKAHSMCSIFCDPTALNSGKQVNVTVVISIS